MGGTRKMQQTGGGREPTASADGSRKRETKRITVDMPRDEHKFLRDAAYEMDGDGMKVMRALLRELRDDEDLFARVRERVAGL